MRDLANRTCMTRPSLYNAFGEVRAIYRLVLDRYIRPAFETRSAIFGGNDSPLRVLAWYFDAIFEEAFADRFHKGCFVGRFAPQAAVP
jgi:TetR/AcrR family transcriptional repressor of nem operon